MAGRLPAAQRALVEGLKELGTRDITGAISWFDIGASDGITTLEAAAALESAFGVRVNTWLCDRFLHLQKYRHGCLCEYRTIDGTPVLARLGRIGLRLPRSPRRFDVLSSWMGRRYLEAGWRRRLVRDIKVPLINPGAAAFPEFRCLEMDIFEPIPVLREKFCALRVSNLFNPELFASPELISALKNLHEYLLPNGLMVISHNVINRDSEQEHGSLWYKEKSGFQHMSDFGDGVRIKKLVSQVQFDDSL